MGNMNTVPVTLRARHEKRKHLAGTLAIYATMSRLPVNFGLHFHTKQPSLHRLSPDGNNEMSMKAFAA